MSNTPHVWDQVADEMSVWMEDTTQKLYDGLMQGGRAPFAGDATEKQKLDYYRSQFYNPDGSDNALGQQDMLKRVGIEGYSKIYRALKHGGSPPDSAPDGEDPYA